MSESKHIVVYVTTPQHKAADVAKQLVRQELVACVNILPEVRSIYRWQGEVCDEGEALLVIKTRRDLFARLSAAVVAIHPYDVPEIVALPLVDGHAPYLAWIDDVTD